MQALALALVLYVLVAVAVASSCCCDALFVNKKRILTTGQKVMEIFYWQYR
jgi:hypothetical protein